MERKNAFDIGDKATVIPYTDEEMRRKFWDERLAEFIGRSVTIRDVLEDSEGYYYYIDEDKSCIADQRFLIPLCDFEMFEENEIELSEPCLDRYLSTFKVVS